MHLDRLFDRKNACLLQKGIVMTDDFEMNVSEQFEADTADRIAVITGISFQKYVDDKVCVHFTYWDADHDKLRKSCVCHSNIFTKRKHLFQQFCEEFDLIEDEKLNLANALNCICWTELHPVYGVILHSVTEDMQDDPALAEAMEQFETVEVDEDIVNIPKPICHYWYNPELNPEEFRKTVYHGMITDLKQDSFRGEEKIIISVAVFAGGKPTVYRHIINEPDYSELDTLAGLFHAEDYMNLLWQQVDFKMFQTGTGKLYVGKIMRPQYKTTAEENQVNLLAKDYRKFIKRNEDSALDYNEQ